MSHADQEHEVVLRFLAEPTEVNFGGKVHGGTVMKWIDHGGYTCAVGWSGQYCVTAYIGGIQFHQPVRIGDIVEVAAKLIYTGNTSMHIAVDVRAGDPKTRQMRKTTSCVVIFVAIDSAGKPTPVPPWDPKTNEAKALHAYAEKLMVLRKGIEDELSRDSAI